MGIFGELVLVAGEEARSCAHGQHAQVLPRADHARAPPRPANAGWCKHQFVWVAHVHGNPAAPRIARNAKAFPRDLSASTGQSHQEILFAKAVPLLALSRQPKLLLPEGGSEKSPGWNPGIRSQPKPPALEGRTEPPHDPDRRSYDCLGETPISTKVMEIAFGLAVIRPERRARAA